MKSNAGVTAWVCSLWTLGCWTVAPGRFSEPLQVPKTCCIFQPYIPKTDGDLITSPSHFDIVL